LGSVLQDMRPRPLSQLGGPGRIQVPCRDPEQLLVVRDEPMAVLRQSRKKGGVGKGLLPISFTSSCSLWAKSGVEDVASATASV